MFALSEIDNERRLTRAAFGTHAMGHGALMQEFVMKRKKEKKRKGKENEKRKCQCSGKKRNTGKICNYYVQCFLRRCSVVI